MLPLKIVILLVTSLVPKLLHAVAYNVSATLPNTITGPNGISFTITELNPFDMNDGDTLTIDNASIGSGIPLGNNQYLIGLSTNNTVTVNSGKNITATFGVGTAGFVFNRTGNQSSKIVIQNGATIATAGAGTGVLYNPASSQNSVMLQNAGTLTTSVNSNLGTSANNVVAIQGSAPPLVNGNLNDGTSLGNSYLYIGGYVDNTNTSQYNATTFSFNNPSILNPFYAARVMTGSVFNLQANIPVATTLGYNQWTVDSGATLNLQASTVTPNQSLTVTNFNNIGITTIAANGAGQAKHLSVNSLLNSGLLNLLGAGAQVNALGTSPRINNTSTGIIIIGSSPTAIIQNFTLITNSGQMVSTGVLQAITTLDNNSGGVISLIGGTYQNIGTINNARQATINFNGATSVGNAGLICNNDGVLNLQSGDFGGISVVNNGLIHLSGGFLGQVLALPTVQNNVAGIITGTAGQIGAGGNLLNSFRNNGSVILSAVPVYITTLTNNGSFSLNNASLNVVNFTNSLNSKLSLLGSASTNFTNPVNNYGTIELVSCSGSFNQILNNYGTVKITGAGPSSMNIVNNYGNFTISQATYSAVGTTFSNNAGTEIDTKLNIDNSDLTMTALVNATGANVAFTGINTFTGNITNDGILSLAGTLNHTGVYSGVASNLILAGTTIYNGNNPLTHSGTLTANISSITNFGSLSINQNISLAGCDLVLAIDQSIAGSQDFTILQVTGGNTIIAAANPFANVNNFLYTLEVVENSTSIKVIYDRIPLTSLVIEDLNMEVLATTLEGVYTTQKTDDLTSLMSALLSYAQDQNDVEKVLQKIAPIAIAPSQNLAVQRNVDHQLAERMITTVIAYNSGEKHDTVATWIRWMSSKSKQQTVANVLGYRFATQGIVLGLEAQTNDAAYLGVAVALNKSVANQLAGLSVAHTTTTQVTAYNQNYWTKNFFSNFLFGMVNNNIKQVKVVNMGSAYMQQSLANYDWQHFFIKGDVGYVLNVSDIYSLIPIIGAKAVYLKAYAYQEYGGGTGIDLNIQSKPIVAVDLSVGASFVADLLLFNQIFQPQINFTFSSGIFNRPYVITASFINSQPFVNTMTVSKVNMQAGIGFKYFIGEEFEGSFSYNLDYHQGFLGRTWQLQAKYIF